LAFFFFFWRRGRVPTGHSNEDVQHATFTCAVFVHQPNTTRCLTFRGHRQIARKLQYQLQLAHYKKRNGLEGLTLDKIEPRVEDEILRRRQTEDGSPLESGGGSSSSSSSSSSARPLSNPVLRGLMSSPLKAPLYDAPKSGSRNDKVDFESSKRSYVVSFDPDHRITSPAKRFRTTPTPRRIMERSAEDTAELLAELS